MASTAFSPQVLHEFVQNLLDDLTGGRITPDAAIIASLQYPYLRALIGDHNDEITGALQDEERLRVILEGVLRAAVVAVNRQLPQFQIEKPDAPLTPNDVVARARAFGRARSGVFAAIRGQRAFIHRLVQNWITQTKPLIGKESQQRLAATLQSELEQGLLGGLSPDEMTVRVGEGAGALRHELVVATQKLAGLAALSKELIGRLSTPRPDWFAAIAIQTISSTALSPSAVFARAASLTRTAEALSGPPPKEGDVAAAGVFFRVFAAGPTQKAFAAAADALLNQLSPFARQEVIKATFSRALEGVLAKTNLLTERLGRDFVESELFRLVVDGARKEFARGAAGGVGVKQARGALEDVFGSILRGPIVRPLIGSPKEMVLSYFDLLAVEARLPHDKRLIFPDHAPTVGALLLLSKNQLAGVRVDVIKDAGFASSGALRAAVSELTQMLPSWRVFYIMMLTSSFSGLGQRALVSLGGIGQGIIKAPGAASIGFFSFFGNVGLRAVSGVGRAGLSLIEGLGGGLIGMMFGGGLGSIFNKFRGPRQPEGFFDDVPKVVALASVIAIVVFFVFPSFFNSRFTSGAAKYAALLVNSQQYNTGGPYEEEFPDYGGPFPSAITAIEACPVSHDRVTQDHHEGVTHQASCAYDFGAPLGEEVRAVNAGCVAYANTESFENGDYKKGSFGNVVRLVGKDKNGGNFYTIYAHLMRGSSPLKRGQCISAGEVIGRVDTTGYTIPAGRGTHLHLEFEYDNRVKPSREQCSAFFSLPPGCGR